MNAQQSFYTAYIVECMVYNTGFPLFSSGPGPKIQDKIVNTFDAFFIFLTFEIKQKKKQQQQLTIR